MCLILGHSQLVFSNVYIYTYLSLLAQESPSSKGNNERVHDGTGNLLVTVANTNKNSYFFFFLWQHKKKRIEEKERRAITLDHTRKGYVTQLNSRKNEISYPTTSNVSIIITTEGLASSLQKAISNNFHYQINISNFMSK